MSFRALISASCARPYRKTKALAALLALVLVVRLVWGWWTAGELQAALDQIRARGEPASLADVQRAVLPDSENAWHFQSQAMAGLNRAASSPRATNEEFPNHPPYTARWMQLADASEKAHGRVFTLVRQARTCSTAQLPPSVTSAGLSTLLPHLNSARHLANTLADGATYAHVTGDDAEAIERLLDLVHLSRSLRHGGPLVPQLVARGVEALAQTATQVIAPGLRFDARSTTRPVTAQKVRNLIAELLDETPIRQGLQQGYIDERLMFLVHYGQQRAGVWMIRPLADREAARMLPNYALLIEAGRCANDPQAQAVVARCRWESGNDKVLERMVARMFGSASPPRDTTPRYSRWFAIPTSADSTRRMFVLHFRGLAEGRTTAVSLACQLYRADLGTWPERLEQLVPTYLPSVPADPFSADGQPLGYLVLKGALPDGGDRPLVYFQDTPGDTPIPHEPTYTYQRRQARQYRDISRFVPPSPSSKAVDDNPEKAGAPGENAGQNHGADQPPGQ